MNTQSDSTDLDLDLELLPAWAQKPSGENQYAKYEGRGDDRPRDRRGDWSDRPPRRDRPPGRDREGAGRRGPGAGPGPRRFADRGGPDRGRPAPMAHREPPPPIKLQIALVPEGKGVESLAKQIRLTGRAYPLFDVAFLVLKRPDRYLAQFDVMKDAEGKPAQPMFWCELDQTLWLSEQEGVHHLLTKHFQQFYKAERVQTEPPKGTYTFVAQCGLSGSILGPPNYHDYQNKLRKLHAERFARMPFEEYKSRIKIVRDEAVVKKWIDEQSWKTEFVCLNTPETVRLQSREEVERHFREHHLANLIKSIETCAMKGSVVQAMPNRSLQGLLRAAWEEQMRFPIKMATHLSQQFAKHGLQFFKVNRTVTHVAVARPHYLDLEATPVSEGVKRIVDYIGADHEATRKKLLATLVPSKTPDPAQPPEQVSDPELAKVNSDLHWLIHQGHVIEFANGRLELAKKPVEKPVVKPPPAASAPAPTPEAAVAETQIVPAASPAVELPAPEPAAMASPEAASASAVQEKLAQ